ncbi:unnamed protein product, partial [Polarella glacialis]
VVLANLFLAAPAAIIFGLNKVLDGWALYSEEEVLQASVLHPLFNTEKHFAEEFWKPSMRQRDRLDALSASVHGTARALESIGIPGFLESAGLIGWLRHGGDQLPWDSDGDLGILVEDCLQ